MSRRRERDALKLQLTVNALIWCAFAASAVSQQLWTQAREINDVELVPVSSVSSQ